MTESFRSGVPVWVYYIDIDTKANIQLPQLLRGLIGQHYTATQVKFHNFKFVEADSDYTGTFDDQPHTIRMYYRRKDWAEVQEVHDMFLKLSSPTMVYDMVNGLPRNTTYPAGTILHAFKRVATSNGKFWYEIGPDQWVEYRQMSISKNPYSDRMPKSEEQELVVTPLNNMPGRIDYIPNKMIQVYDQPYGKIINELEHDTTISITGKATNSDGVVWYEINKRGFVNGTYVKTGA
ncbi:MucBP domain-containing protein [Paucilactobacillus kaifaensis]|uniref:MucBP domain-containing protein n=1 Tax=Paucilactobacillus kaifaensis TaxID=2559921 RepID=UPI0010F885D8|nr:MucBP domain-containing protein [Paucilactobacillus kaifaensis]